MDVFPALVGVDLGHTAIDEVNVQLVMERLGGGGHMTIAGAQLREVNPDEAKMILQKTIDTMIQEGAI